RIPADRFATAAEFVAGLTQPLTITLAEAVPAPDHSIAVLPFVNLSADPENGYFCDGMTEEILNALSAVPSLRVASRTSSFALKGRLEGEASVALVEPHTDNVEAYAFYLKARYFWKKKSASALKHCLEYFEQAIALDPHYSLAHAGLADSYVMLAYHNYVPPK